MGIGGGGGGEGRRLIFLLIVCLPLVASLSSEAPPVNCRPYHPTTDAIGHTPPSSEASPPLHGCGDQDPVPGVIGGQELRSAALAEAVVLALLTARKDERTELMKAFLILVLLSAFVALLFSEIPPRNMCPRFTKIMAVIFVNGVMALRLPTKFLWVPVVCFGISLLTLVACTY